jgi:uncharacterized protein GlcG (DUF336 family)/mannose-6-phosphate isomerase-like protein (cupin superfamily)
MEKLNMIKVIAVTIVFACATLSAGLTIAKAQSKDKKSLTLDGARLVIKTAIASARRNNAPGAVIAVVDDGGNLMALERLDGTFAAGATISIGKARTAALFKQPTKFFEDAIRNGRTAMTALPDSLFTPLQGGVPIVMDGQVVGGVGVSGSSSQQQDEDLAVAGASVLLSLAATAADPAAIRYWDAKDVEASFAKGAPLVDGSAGKSYKVITGHRVMAGNVEVHTFDADVFYIVDGSATIVTGGTIVDAKVTGDGEVRGTSIEGGQTRVLKKGDVITIEPGMPHWFKEVQGTLSYFVVKSK